MSLTFNDLPEAVENLTQELKEIKQILLELKNASPKPAQEELLTVSQAADFLGLAKATIYSKVSRRELPVMKRAKRLYFSKEELWEYLKAGRIKTIGEIEEEAELYLTRKQ